jgi:hypothetical protein
VTFRNRAFFTGARPSAIFSARSTMALMALLSCCSRLNFHWQATRRTRAALPVPICRADSRVWPSVK